MQSTCIVYSYLYINHVIIRYDPISPIEFRMGDTVEVAFSFVGIALSGGRYKVLHVLRAITLLETILHYKEV